MSDRARHDPDVRDRLADWHDLADVNATLRADIARWELEISRLVVENADLRRRLDAMRAERDAAQRANRQRDWRGMVVMLWDWLNGGTR